MVSIDSRAIFIGQGRSFAIDTNRFPTTESGCIYFLQPLATLLNSGITASLLRLTDQRQEDAVVFGTACWPPTLVQVLTDHCRYTPNY